MKTLTLIIGMAFALLAGFCAGYDFCMRFYYKESLSPRLPRGYTLIEAGKAVNHSGDTVSVGFRGFSRNSEPLTNN
jgi:hypothetical protein